MWIFTTNIIFCVTSTRKTQKTEHVFVRVATLRVKKYSLSDQKLPWVTLNLSIGHKTNKYNTVINPLGRLGIYRFITYKKQLHCFTAEQIIKLLILFNRMYLNRMNILFYLNKINNLIIRSAVKQCNCFL